MSRMGLSRSLPNLTRPATERLAATLAGMALCFRRVAHRRELAGLGDRQLHDAGIDPALAGRGKAAAADGAALRRLRSLSCR